MGKKPLISGRYLARIETVLLISISFIVMLLFNENRKDLSEIKEYSEIVKEKLISEEIEKKTSVFFDSKIGEIEKKMIINAKNSIKIATYTYSAGFIAELLNKKNDEGVNVTVVAGNNKDNSVPGFKFLLFQTKYGIFHPKFMVFDSKDVIIASSNISSDNKSSNSAVLFRNVPELAKILEKEIDDISIGRVEKRCEKGCETEAGTVYFNPGKGCIAVKNEFLKAERTIKASVYTVTIKNPVITGIKNAMKKGVKVEMIVDNWKGDDRKIVNKRAVNYLSSKGVKVKYDENQSENAILFHHKFAVIDHSTTVFGSMNWTSSGCYRNRELIVISKDPEIAKEFESFFDKYKKF